MTANGLDGFFDFYSIQAGDDIPAKIAKGLEECDVYIPILSPNALASPWCEKEIGLSTTLSMIPEQNGKPRIVPIIAKKCKIPTILLSTLYIDFSDQYGVGLQRLLTQGFGVTPKLPNPPTPPTPQNLENARTFPNWFVPVSAVVGMLVSAIALGLVVNSTVNDSTLVLPTKAVASVPITVVPTAFQSTTATSAIGSSKISPIDGATMMYVPAGEFTMGSSDGENDEKPERLVYLVSVGKPLLAGKW